MKTFFVFILSLCLTVCSVGQTKPTTAPAPKLYDSTMPHVVGANSIRMFTVAGIPGDSSVPKDVSQQWMNDAVKRAKLDGAAKVCWDCEQLIFHSEGDMAVFSYTNPHDRQVLSCLRLTSQHSNLACRDANLDWGWYNAGIPNTAMVNTQWPPAQAEAVKQRQLFLNIGNMGNQFTTLCGYSSPATLQDGGFEIWRKELMNQAVLQHGLAPEIIVYMWPFVDHVGEYPPPVPIALWKLQISAIHDAGLALCVWGWADPNQPQYGVIDPNGEHLQFVRQVYGK
jgi:hypothetical protein